MSVEPSDMHRAVATLSNAVRLRWDTARGQHVLLGPETVIMLNPTAARILQLCDGSRTVRALITELEALHPGAPIERDVLDLLTRLHARTWITLAQRSESE